MSILTSFSDSIAAGLSGVVVMAFGYIVINKIKSICLDCKHKNNLSAMRNAK